MAGEVEDRTSLQADCLPTGSISFGRFEAESLSWERRSSFSHNRYLEEVEKYSTPGSVTQKKAYFEAHFKKKALLRQASSESQNGIDGQAENNIEDNMNYMEEFENHANGGLQFEGFGDHINEGIEFSWYDETPDVSDEHEVVGAELDEVTSPSELPVESTLSNVGTVIDNDVRLVECAETVESKSKYDTVPSSSNVKEIIVEQKLALEVENVGAEKMKTSAKIPVETSQAPSLKKTQKPSAKGKVTVEEKPGKAKLKTRVPATQSSLKISSETDYLSSTRTSSKPSKNTEVNSLIKAKVEKKLSSRVQPSMCSASKVPKSKDSENVKVKVRPQSKSEKGPEAKKFVVPPSTSETIQTDVLQSANRPKRVINPVKPETKTSGIVFSFKSDERAEKRKEFYTMLEEKLHAKEVEMNEIQAKTQEETEAQIKQFRRSLNFKATPMPTFYHDSAPRVSISDGKKATIPRAKSPKPRSKCTSPVNKTKPRDNSPAISKSSNPQGPSTSEQSNTIQQDTTSEADSSCPTALANVPEKTDAGVDAKQESQPDMKIEAGKREGKAKVILHQMQGDIKSKKVVGVSKTRRSGVGKVMEGMGGGSVAVHVAS